MTAAPRYNTQLGAGLGAISETIELLRVWKPGMDAAQLTSVAVSDGVFARNTARRTRNLVMEMFAPRFLGNHGRAAAQIKLLVENRLSQEGLVQLFYLQTARTHSIFHDFIAQVYWPKYSAGASYIIRDDAELFIQRALDAGYTVKRWSPQVVERLSRYLIGTCLDYGLLAVGNRVQRPIQRFFIRPEVSLYLAHDLHFSGHSDMAIVQHPDWQLFGLESREVVNQLKNLAANGDLFVQSSGELIQLSWKYRTMEECLHALVKG